MDKELVFVGKIIDLQPIPNADFIVSATVVCGEGGKWKEWSFDLRKTMDMLL